MRNRLGRLLCYSPPPHAHTLLVIWPVENVVTEIPDMMKAAEIMSATIIFRIVLSPFVMRTDRLSNEKDCTSEHHHLNTLPT